MRINSILNCYNINKTSPLKQKLYFGASYNSNPLSGNDVFVKSAENKSVNEDKLLPEEFFCAPGKVSFPDYVNIKEHHNEILQRARNITHEYEVFPAAYCASALKYNFDTKYGENGYRIISLGTSPAVLCEAMSAMGSDVIFMPASNIHSEPNSKYRSFQLKNWENKCMMQSLNYVKSKGVKNSLHYNKNNKKYILIDLALSGDSIKVASDLITKTCGLKKTDLIICPITDELSKLEDILDLNGYYVRAYIRNMYSSRVAAMCNVPHFDVNDSIYLNENTAFNYFDLYSRPYARAVSLCILDDIDKNNNELDKFSAKKGRTSFQDYKYLKSNYPIVLVSARSIINADKCVEPKHTAKAADAIKKYFDKQYGEDGYRIISLGTSPAFICEAMQNLGSDVLFMPISGLHKNKKIDDDDTDININIALRYLKKRLEEKNNSDKKNIIIDYVCTGLSLDNAVNLIANKTNIAQDNIVKCSLLDLLYKLCQDDDYDLSYAAVEKIETAVIFSEVDDICCVPHFDAYWHEGFSDEEVFDKFDNYSTSLARLYQLCVCDELKKIQDAQKKSE